MTAPLPHDLDLERSLLGLVLIRASAYHELADHVSETDFFRDAHQKTWQLCAALADNHQRIDLFAVARLAEQRRYSDVTLAFLSSLTDGMVAMSPDYLWARVEQLRDLADRRRLVETCLQGQRVAVDAPTAEEAAERLIAGTRDAVRVSSEAGATIGEVVATAISAVDDTPRPVPTGLPMLDAWGCGFRPGELTILAGRPSHGKSALALSLAVTAARAGTRVWFASLEMSKAAIGLRALASEANVDLLRLRGAQLSPTEYRGVSEAVERLQGVSLRVDDRAGMTLGDLRRLVFGERGLIVVDYLQLMRPPREATKYGSRVQEVGALSRGLKGLAHDTGCSVLALSQLSRAVETRVGNVPQLSDIRESGDVEADADQVWFVWRPPLYDDEELADRACLKVAKHRNGPTGTVELVFTAGAQRFRERTASDPQVASGPSVSRQARDW